MKKFLLQVMSVIAIVFLLSACSGNENVSKEEADKPDDKNEVDKPKDKNEANKPEDKNEEVEPTLALKELSDQIIKALDSRDMSTIANHVDPDEGLLFSPYVYVTDDAVIFEESEVASILDSSTKYNWGRYDGKGTPIELTPNEHFAEFLDMTAYQDPDSVKVNDPQHRGNTKNNIKDKFPEA